MNFLTARYDPWLVLTSVWIASLASYVALDLAKRVRGPDLQVARIWWVAGSLAMGTGIWSMHFTGMLAFSLSGVALGYTLPATVLSWIAGVAVSGVALAVASRGRLGFRRLATGSIAMALGICAMHYIGMAALDMAPGVVWDPLIVAASAAIALAASAAALSIFFWLRTVSQRHGLWMQALAALAMGLAISGMHYTGMAAVSFPEGSVCLSATQLSADRLGATVIVASVLLLAATQFTSVLDARMQGKANRLAQSLREANAKLRSAFEELKKHAFIDVLTGLPNRVLFEDRLAHAVARCSRADRRHADAARAASRLAVLFVDLDGFKPVNDSLGHAAGDIVLKQVATRLLHEVRSADTVARIGGDEFVLLVEDLTSADAALALADRLVRRLAQPFDVLHTQVELSASIGTVVYPDQGNAAKLVAHADAAMYAAKRAGGNTHALFESHMTAGADAQMALLHDLRHAAERGELHLYYQPKIEGRRGAVSGVEALLRWNHPTRGPVSPAEFIPIAERFGLIGGIGNWVIDEACRQMRAWWADGLHLRVAVNLSVHQLRQEDLVQRIRDALVRNDISPARLTCEITESAAMDDLEATRRAFEKLVHSGVQLSIDDFGTGHSSLAYLRSLPATQLKIDRSFVQDIGGESGAIVDAVVRLAHALGLRVVAEGVETEDQRDRLLALGCDELQGFLFARPMAPDALAQWLRQSQAAPAAAEPIGSRPTSMMAT
ncbi:MAG: EAL domain-containing protein [Burkholderiaceae bacterium]|nr:EAL domain-containing protein [Burkholderiaceae bacterium]